MFLFLDQLRKRVDEDGDPSILLPKKKRAKDKKKNNKKTKKPTSKRKRELGKVFQQAKQKVHYNIAFKQHLANVLFCVFENCFRSCGHH